MSRNFNKYGDFIITSKLQKTKELYRFGAFQLDSAERILKCENEFVALTPKQFDLLFYFVENAGRLAKKDELLDAVWTDTYIEETTLARNVSWLRKKLAEYADGEQFIETVPKLGYRFAAEVTRFADEENALIVEEQIVQHFRSEEIITISDAELFGKGEEEKRRKGEQENKIAELPSHSPSSLLPFSSSRFLLFSLIAVALAGIGLIVYQNYFKTRATNAIVALSVAPFSGAPGYENSPAFSPDGNRLAYSWNGGDGGDGDIYVKLIGAGEPLQITKTKTNEQYPAFSPDGKHIAFVRGKYGTPGEVIIIPSLGGAERRIARLFSGNYSISFSPDGQNIAVIDTENSIEDGQYAVYLINIESGERRRVTAPAEFLGETTPRFSPDGKNLAFIRVAKEDVNVPLNGKQDLFVVPTSGGEPRQITFDGVIINSLAWSADGEYIYFVPVRPPNQTVVRRIPAGGGAQEIVSTGGRDITNIAVAPNGKTLVFAEDVRGWSIVRVTPDGRQATDLMESNASELFPQFSPDNSRIAFQSERTGKFQIWTADANGKNLRQITDMPFPSGAPQFSPDGSLIAFNQKANEDFANFIVSSEGGTPRRISPESAQEDFPVWSADGRFLYFSSTRAGIRNIFRTNGDGTGDVVQITTIGAFRGLPSLDGKTFYFTKTGFPEQLWRVPAEGGAEELVEEITNAGFFHFWAMAKDGIYFLAPAADKSIEMKFYDYADKQVKNARGSYKIPSNLDGTFITFDGNVLLCSVMEKSSRLMLAKLEK